MAKIKLTIGFMFCCFAFAIGQSDDRYVVFLSDKEGTPYSISSPEEFLTVKAINRPGRTITAEDLPLNPNYVAGVEEAGANILQATKWFNAVLIEATSDEITAIEALPYVSGWELVALGSKPLPGGRIGSKVEGGVNGRLELKQQELLGIPKMHLDGYMGENISIAVLDAGFENVDQNNYFSHVFDENRMKMACNLVTGSTDVYDGRSNHGSRVFSTIAANIDNGYVGTAPKSDFYLFITEEAEAESPIEEYYWTVAAEKADSAGVDIITTSLGYSTFDVEFTSYTHDDLDGATTIITQAAEKAFLKGIFVVSSAGNEGNKEWVKVTAPADGEHVLAVGSIDNNLLISDFSSIGPVVGNRIKPDVVAVGEGAVIVTESSTLIMGKGTSYSAPQVAGLIAGLWQKYPTMTNLELFDTIISTASNTDSPDNNFGYGIPNYLRFTNFIEGITAVDNSSDKSGFILHPNPLSSNELFVKGTNSIVSPNKITICNSSGTVLFTGVLKFDTSNNVARLDLDNIPAGLYMILIESGEQIQRLKLVKQ